MSEIWIQLENRSWYMMPWNIDRMTNRNAKTITGKNPEMVTITSPGTGITHQRRMYAPLRDGGGKVMDALIFRRYKPPAKPDKSDAWTVPDDRKVNPWDINEQDPTDSGTMGTIPGPVIECNVGEQVLVHFRNLDMRLTKAPKARAHSMHVHGFVFEARHDGAYPLSPPDSAQSIPASEQAAWTSVSVTGPNKMGDRVPPEGTFDYTWNTFGWPSTTGVWLYHDHSFCDMENMRLGAIGIVVIHNPADTQNDFVLANTDFPDGDHNGNPLAVNCFPLNFPVAIDKTSLAKLGRVDPDILALIDHASLDHMDGRMNMGKDKAESKPAKTEDFGQQNIQTRPQAAGSAGRYFAPSYQRFKFNPRILYQELQNATVQGPVSAVVS